jgi:hypothetical protein
MSEQQEEDLLHDVFALANRDAAGTHVPKQRIAKPVEQGENVPLERRLFKDLGRRARRERREAQCRFWCGAADHERVTDGRFYIAVHSAADQNGSTISAKKKA